MSAAPTHNELCTNCGIRLSGPFCPECGQKDRELNPPLGHFVAEATDELLNVDGKIFRSVWTLLAKPGVLTRDFFDGRRTRWVSPIRLYLMGSVLYFGYASLYDDSGSMQSTGRLMFVLLPVFAWLVSRVSALRLHFPQHMYFALHVHSAWLVAWFVREAGAELLSPRVMASTRWLGHVVLAYSLAYVVMAYRRAYREELWRSALKMAIVGMLYGVALVGVLMAAAWFLGSGHSEAR